MKNILFVEVLKDYVTYSDGQRIITRMRLKNIRKLLTKNVFPRINRSYIVNKK
ncbi:MAG: LytTR family transcriptional regulator [Prevotellaceae bacterium]|nr:LytTR family transcriptional regulator [Prevotellaceae bacterium]